MYSVIAIVLVFAVHAQCLACFSKGGENGATESSRSSQSALHFDKFVLFGHIHALDKLRELSGHNFQLYVDVQENTWKQNIESKYYSFELPTNLSSLMGELSIRAGEEGHTEIFWHQSFLIQDDIGAHRLDIDIDDTLLMPHYCLASQIGGGMMHLVMEKKELQHEEHDLLKCQDIMLKDQIDGCCEAQAVSEGVPVSTTLRPSGVEYPWQLFIYANILQLWHGALYFCCFGMVQLLNTFLGKSIAVMEAAESHVSKRDHLRSRDENTASWVLCFSKPAVMAKSWSENMPYSGEGSFEDAWHDAEHYLSKALKGHCQGAYFAYNCIVTQQERQEPTFGGWNRDNAGRLIRQIWDGQ